MGKAKQIEIKNRTYYFYNDIINIEEFNSSSLKIDKKLYKDIDIKNEIETISGGKKGECGEDIMKTKFNTGDNLPLNKPLKLHLLTISVRCTFVEDGKFNCNFI